VSRFVTKLYFIYTFSIFEVLIFEELFVYKVCIFGVFEMQNKEQQRHKAVRH
jgi:hypothetical protein